jgi:hypothetical protein
MLNCRLCVCARARARVCVLYCQGRHTREILLCKIAPGKMKKTQQDMPHLQGAAPEGYNSVYGDARASGMEAPGKIHIHMYSY